mmetsp:Transcript_3644/g.11341  ORF Transcript_3644/g.11341 Transcript_3644/m.11341 type:complete len:344 (-) Transcript_3644:74-1105(-)
MSARHASSITRRAMSMSSSAGREPLIGRTSLGVVAASITGVGSQKRLASPRCPAHAGAAVVVSRAAANAAAGSEGGSGCPRGGEAESNEAGTAGAASIGAVERGKEGRGGGVLRSAVRRRTSRPMACKLNRLCAKGSGSPAKGSPTAPMPGPRCCWPAFGSCGGGTARGGAAATTPAWRGAAGGWFACGGVGSRELSRARLTESRYALAIVVSATSSERGRSAVPPLEEAEGEGQLRGASHSERPSDSERPSGASSARSPLSSIATGATRVAVVAAIAAAARDSSFFSFWRRFWNHTWTCRGLTARSAARLARSWRVGKRSMAKTSSSTASAAGVTVHLVLNL